MPVLLLTLILPELFTIAFIVFDIHLFREWYLYHDTNAFEHARHCLYGFIALMGYIMLGKMPVKYLVSRLRKSEDEPKYERSTDTEKLTRPDGSVINIEFLGDKKGQPILFVHGWNENLLAWYYEKNHFAKNNYIILIDLPGLGKSKGPDNNDYSLQKMAADLEAVIEHLNINHVVLWGHSIGGMVILTYCTQVGKNVNQRIKGLILQHTTYTNPTHTSILSGLLTAIQKPILEPICYIMIGLWPIMWLSKWMSYLNGSMLLSTRFTTFAGSQTPSQLDFISRLSAIAPPNVFARGMLGMMRTYDVTHDLKNISIPTLIFGAKSDRLTKPVASEVMHQQIPNSKLVILSPAGHQGLVERHEESNREAEAFIKRLN